MLISTASSPAIANTPAIVQQTEPLQLKDIHLPEQVSHFPVAYGWWILLTLCITFIIWGVYRLKKRIQQQKSKKYALSILSSEMSIAQTISLLKWVTIQSFERSEVAKLYGKEFQVFLSKQLPKKHQKNFKTLSDEAFTAQYQASNPLNKNITLSCQQAAQLWLTHALPVNKTGGEHD